MDPDELVTTIGENLRRLREGKQLSQDGLAEVADLSKGTIVAIEQQRSNPSIATLLALADALDVGLANLLEAPAGPMVKVRPAGHGVRWWETPAGSHGDLVLGTDPPNGVEVWAWWIEPGDHYDGPPHTRGTIETLRVSSGTVALTVGTQQVTGTPGDVIAFEAHVPHRYASAGDDPAGFDMWIRVPDAGPSRDTPASH